MNHQTNEPFRILLVVSIGALLSSMASSMINLALPTISRDFNISIEDSRWVAQAFLLAVGVTLPIAGRIGEMMGHGRVYLLGHMVFGVCAILGGLAASFEWLVAARVLQGLGGAMIWSNGPALLTTTFPVQLRGRALGTALSSTYIGLTVGPSLGGLLVSALDWRWTFYFFGPTTAAVLWLGIRYMPRQPKSDSGSAGWFDWLGGVFLLTTLPPLLVVMNQAQSWGWNNLQTWLFALFGLIGLYVFTRVERRVKQTGNEPLLDLSLFRVKTFTLSVFSAFANYINLFIILILLPFYLEEGLGHSPSNTGLLLSIQPLVMAVCASPAGWLADRFGSRYPATVGMLVLTIGMLGLSGLGDATSPLHIAIWLIVVGLGTGIFISPNSSTLMGSAPKNRQGTAGSFMAQARVLGMLIGVAIGTSIFQASGGKTGQIWGYAEFTGIRRAFWAAALIAFLGALASWRQIGPKNAKL